MQRLRQITEHRAITLIGESWGGAVALAMAQTLESQGVLVSLSLLNGVPGHVLEWITENVTANHNMNASLLSRYLSIDDEVPYPRGRPVSDSRGQRDHGVIIVLFHSS